MPEINFRTEKIRSLPFKKIVAVAVAATPVATFISSNKIRTKVLDALFGPEEDFEYTSVTQEQ